MSSPKEPMPDETSTTTTSARTGESSPASFGAPSVDELLGALESIYSRKSKAADYAAEQPVLREVLPTLQNKLKDANYRIQAPIAIGSTATVWLVQDQLLEKQRALKLPRPRLGRVRSIVSIMRAERARLASLGHPNIIRVYHAGEIQAHVADEEYAFPFFVMDYLEGVQDLDEFIVGNYDDLPGSRIVGFLHDVLLGLSFLHDHDVIHCDIKPGNLLIAPGTGALIADLGYAKNIVRQGSPDSEFTDVTHTPKYAHPHLTRTIIESSDSNATHSRIMRDQLQPRFDLFALGRTIQELLTKLRNVDGRRRSSDATSRSHLSPYQWQYLEIVARRLLDGCIVAPQGQEDGGDVIPGLTGESMKEIRYETADEALEDIQKLLNLYDLEGEVPELNPNIGSYVQIPLAKVPMTPRVERILNHPIFARLNQATQLGFVSLVYPGGCHSRAEHVQGTFAGVCDYIRALWYDEANCLFRSVMRRKDIEAGLLAALLHDVGQYAMAHDLTEISARFNHERFTRPLLELHVPGTDQSLGRQLERDWEVSVDDLMGVLEKRDSTTFRQRVLHSLISGPLDCDKLDYLRRDSLHLGVSFGVAIDRDRLLRNLSVAYRTIPESVQLKDGRPGTREQFEAAEIAVSEKALAAARSVLTAREDMHTQVYWQHSVRSLKAMLSYVVRQILASLDTEARQQDFWASLTQFVVTGRHASTAQRVADQLSAGDDSAGLFDEPEAAHSAPWSTLSAGDDGLLTFLGTYANDSGKRMLKAIRERKLYRRVAVMSGARSPEPYQHIYSRFRTYRDDENFAMIEDGRRSIEARLIER